MRIDDLVEVDDDETLHELIQINKRLGIRLCLKAVESKHSPKLVNRPARSAFQAANILEEAEDDDDDLESNKNQLLCEIKRQRKQIKGLKENLNQIEEATTEADHENRDKLNQLENEYQALLFQTVQTKHVDRKAIQKLEHKLVRIKNKQIYLGHIFDEIIKAEQVDFCFLVDCTSSMSTYIDEVSATINHIVNKLSKQFRNFKIRCALVGYRDHSESAEERIINTTFVDDVETFKMIASEIVCFGGGDECEFVHGGLNECVNNLDWMNPSRILFHICDSPCHGIEFHDEWCQDFYPGGDPSGLSVKEMLKKVNDLELNYFFVEINFSTKKMIEQFNKELNGNQIRCVQLNQIEELGDAVSKSIATTIAQTTKSIKSKHLLKNRKVSNASPDWSVALSTFKKYKADYFSK